jgi:hypothetical protein
MFLHVTVWGLIFCTDGNAYPRKWNSTRDPSLLVGDYCRETPLTEVDGIRNDKSASGLGYWVPSMEDN